MLEIEKNTCIRFEDRSKNGHQELVTNFMCKIILVALWNCTLNKDYIEFRLGHGCYSSAGRSGQRQEIVLNPLCGEKHTLIHEVASVYTKIMHFEKFS